VADVEHGDGPARIVDLVYHTIVPDADSPARSTGKLAATGRARVIGEQPDTVTDPLVGLLRQTGELTLGATENEQRIAH
jgi:hypothetical protein